MAGNVITIRKKVLVVCLAGARSLLRPEKKSSSRDFYAKFECMEFEFSKFVLVLAKIDLIHLEHSICISST
jgi:hypothetical protein